VSVIVAAPAAFADGNAIMSEREARERGNPDGEHEQRTGERAGGSSNAVGGPAHRRDADERGNADGDRGGRAAGDEDSRRQPPFPTHASA
jgi:hypothetical protein